MINLKGAAIMVALTVAQPAHAADFIRYTFHSTGSGLATTIDFSTGKRTESIITGVAIWYVLPITGFFGTTYTTTSSDRQEFNAPTTDRNSYAGGSSILTATGSTLRLSESGSVPRGQFGSTVATACADINGVFPTVSFSSKSGCGSARIDFAGRSSSLSFNGFVDWVDVVLGTGEPTQPYGLAGFTTFVPEPAGWAMMLVGFGMIGATARYRRRSVCRSALKSAPR